MSSRRTESIVVESRLRGADTRKKLTLDGLRLGIRDYIATVALQEGIERSEVPCPPLGRWGVPPLPSPTRLLLCSLVSYDNSQACVEAEFAFVQADMPPRPSQTFGEAVGVDTGAPS